MKKYLAKKQGIRQILLLGHPEYPKNIWQKMNCPYPQLTIREFFGNSYNQANSSVSSIALTKYSVRQSSPHLNQTEGDPSFASVRSPDMLSARTGIVMHSLMVSASATCPVHQFSNPATTTYASGSSLLSWFISSFTFMGYLYVFVYFITLNGRANNCSETKKVLAGKPFRLAFLQQRTGEQGSNSALRDQHPIVYRRVSG